jgi:hypothetical protein
VILELPLFGPSARCGAFLPRRPAHVGVWLRLLRTLLGFGPLSN